jgi:hypothetical protein
MPAQLMTAAALVASIAAAGAPTANEVLGPAFNNTIVSVYPDGKSTRTWLHPNGTYDGLRANGQRTFGSWELKGEKLCLTQKKPFFVPLAFCTAIPARGGVGASWMAKGLKGEPVRHTLSPGRMPTP